MISAVDVGLNGRTADSLRQQAESREHLFCLELGPLVEALLNVLG